MDPIKDANASNSSAKVMDKTIGKSFKGSDFLFLKAQIS